MAQVSEHRSSTWVAFAAGAVVMLVLALIWVAWFSHAGAGRVVRVAAETASGLPDMEMPRLPGAPRLPDAPKPIPK